MATLHRPARSSIQNPSRRPPPPFLQRLAGKEWTARVSATRLFTPTYARCPPEHRPDLLRAFLALTKDETPMVRRAAAQALGDFAQVVEPEPLSAELLPAFLQLTRDGESSGMLAGEKSCLGVRPYAPGSGRGTRECAAACQAG